MCRCIVDVLSDLPRIQSFFPDVNASEIVLGFEVMCALLKYLQHEAFLVEINLASTLDTNAQDHLTIEINGTENKKPIRLSSNLNLDDLFADVDTLMTTSLRVGQLTAELWAGYRPEER